MKIAEAFALRADLQTRLEQLKQRFVKNARIKEGDSPEEDPAELQSDLEKLALELMMLIQGSTGRTPDPGLTEERLLTHLQNETF